MKYFLALLYITISISAFSQADSILNESLDKEEYEFLNSNLDKNKYNYDFDNKKVAFFSSPSGTILCSKKDFFQYENGKINGKKYFDIIIFNEKEKLKHGYDVAVIYDSKNIKPSVSNRLKRIVKRNKNKTR